MIENRHAARGRTTDLGKVEVLLESGSDRVGALDLQASSDTYVPRPGGTATLDELAEAADRIEAGQILPPALNDALLDGSSIGGARRQFSRSRRDLLSGTEARGIIDRQVDAIQTHWDEACEAAQLTEVDRSRLRQRQFLNPHAFEGY